MSQAREVKKDAWTGFTETQINHHDGRERERKKEGERVKNTKAVP